jgi:peroxiredoxin
MSILGISSFRPKQNQSFRSRSALAFACLPDRLAATTGQAMVLLFVAKGACLPDRRAAESFLPAAGWLVTFCGKHAEHS